MKFIILDHGFFLFRNKSRQDNYKVKEIGGLKNDTYKINHRSFSFLRNVGYQIFGKTKILEEALDYVRENLKDTRYICVDANPLSKVPQQLAIRYYLYYLKFIPVLQKAKKIIVFCFCFFPQNQYFPRTGWSQSKPDIFLFRYKEMSSNVCKNPLSQFPVTAFL